MKAKFIKAFWVVLLVCLIPVFAEAETYVWDQFTDMWKQRAGELWNDSNPPNECYERYAWVPDANNHVSQLYSSSVCYPLDPVDPDDPPVWPPVYNEVFEQDSNYVRLLGAYDECHDQVCFYRYKNIIQTLTLNGVTTSLPNNNGEIYALYNLPVDQNGNPMSYTIDVEGEIWQEPEGGVAALGAKFRHTSRWSVPFYIYNPIWESGGWDTRRCIELDEDYSQKSRICDLDGICGPWGSWVTIYTHRKVAYAFDTGLWRVQNNSETGYVRWAWIW
ncbi:MAG: hypothetical protein JW943_01740 [Deltaproteobacteria bacterium]|nr:hypothetical protein [Deltaproteobacteria bacterium]